MRIRLLPIALVLAAGCVDSGPPVWAPSAQTGGALSEACVKARALVARAPGLAQEGRIDRLARVLTRAEEICPAEAASTWALRVRALADLGRTTEAFQLAARIERSDRAGDTERAAAKAARAIAEERARQTTEGGTRRDAPELFDPSDKHRAEGARLFRSAADASRAGDHATAQRLFLEAWQAARPDPRALVEAGLEAMAQGRRAEAQTLWDRAAYDDSTLAAAPVMVTGAPAAVGARAIAWSSKGDRLAVSGDHAVEVFDADLHAVLRVTPKDTVTAVGFSADGSRLYVGLESGAIQTFDARSAVARGELAAALSLGETAKPPLGARGVRAIAASADGRFVAAATDAGTVGVWDGDGVHVTTLPARRGARRAAVLLAFDAESRHLAVAEEDGEIARYRFPEGTLDGRSRAHRGPVLAMAFSAPSSDGGPSLDVITANERVRWEQHGTSPPRPVTVARAHASLASLRSQAAGAPRAIAGVVDGTSLVVGDLDAKEGERAATTTEHGGLTSFALSPSGAVIAVVFKDRSMAILPAGERREPRRLGPSGPVRALATTPMATSETAVLAAALDDRVVVWRSAGERVHVHEIAGARSLALSRDGATLAMGLESRRVEVRDLGGARSDVFVDAEAPVVSLAIAADGTHLALGTEAPSVLLADASTRDPPRSLPFSGGAIHAVRFSSDGSVIVASKDGLTLYRGAEPAARLGAYGPDVRDVAFSPDGSSLVVATQRGELLLGKPRPLPPATPQAIPVPARVIALALAKDGAIVTAEGDRSVVLRSPNGKQGHRFRDPGAPIRFVGFLGTAAAAGLDDGSVHVFRAPDPGPSAILELVPGLAPGKLAGIVRGPHGQLELVGPDANLARAAVRCLVGGAFYPLDVCAEQFVVDGVLPMVLAGKDPSEAEP